jgi:hypothetical protein
MASSKSMTQLPQAAPATTTPSSASAPPLISIFHPSKLKDWESRNPHWVTSPSKVTSGRWEWSFSKQVSSPIRMNVTETNAQESTGKPSNTTSISSSRPTPQISRTLLNLCSVGMSVLALIGQNSKNMWSKSRRMSEEAELLPKVIENSFSHP